ncbi:MAG TPA: family 1 encapsulin nanocompartment shell protein [Polyangiaceae bacterium]|nr:family 1 encapsulin nanocompartment shell protein [Polyangiaceae bacterium]
MITGPGPAPIAPAVWAKLEADVKEVLEEHFVGRRIVDFDGPHGLGFSALNLGELVPCDVGPGISAGQRAVLPLIEARVPFELPRSAFDARERGAPDLDDDAALTAARTLAELEDRAIFYGIEAAGIRGVLAESSHPRIPLGGDVASTIDAVTRALLVLDEATVKGPYAVVLGNAAYRRLASAPEYPPLRQLRELVGGQVLHSRVLRGGVVLSLRGEDYQLSVGQDAAIGYLAHDADKVSLYLVQSFAFVVMSPEAIVGLDE